MHVKSRKMFSLLLCVLHTLPNVLLIALYAIARLNCALYIFDKAAQDQVIGVTDHELLPH